MIKKMPLSASRVHMKKRLMQICGDPSSKCGAYSLLVCVSLFQLHAYSTYTLALHTLVPRAVNMSGFSSLMNIIDGEATALLA